MKFLISVLWMLSACPELHWCAEGLSLSLTYSDFLINDWDTNTGNSFSDMQMTLVWKESYKDKELPASSCRQTNREQLHCDRLKPRVKET